MIETIGSREIESTTEMMTRTVEKQIENATNVIKVNARIQSMMQSLRLTLFATNFLMGDDTTQGNFGEEVYSQIKPLGKNMDLYL